MPKFFHEILEQTFLTANATGKEVEVLKKELESNFLDHKEYLVSQGWDPKGAEEEVIKRFGNPKVIGKMFLQCSLKKKNIQHARMLTWITGIISILIGLYYVYSIRVINIRSCIILAIIGCLTFIITSKIIQKKFWQHQHYLAITTFFFLAIIQILFIIQAILFLTLERSCSSLFAEIMCRRTDLLLQLGILTPSFILTLWAMYEIFLLKKIQNFLQACSKSLQE